METTVLSDRLKKVVKAFEDIKKSGIDPEILEIYLQHKTKLKRGEIQALLKHQESFYRKLISREAAEKA